MRSTILLVCCGLLTGAMVCGQNSLKENKSPEHDKKSKLPADKEKKANGAGETPKAEETAKPKPVKAKKAAPDGGEKTGDDGTESSRTDPSMTIREFDITCPSFTYIAQTPRETCSDAASQGNNNAEEIAKSLDGAVAGIRVKALDKTRLLIFWKDKEAEPGLPKLEALIRKLSARVPPAELDESRIIRLYNNRNASQVAEALSEEFENVKVKAVGTDTIVIGGNDDKATQPISEMSRFVAHLDLPRPEVTLNVWSVQLSSKDPKKLEDDAQSVRDEIVRYNKRLQDALDRGWRALGAGTKPELVKSLFKTEEVASAPRTSGEWFREYVGKLWVGCPDFPSPSDYAKCISDSKLRGVTPCPQQRYCLGYHQAFDLNSPSLTRLLLVLASSDSPTKVAGDVVTGMENEKLEGSPGGGKTSKSKAPEIPLVFTSFREELLDLLKGERLGGLRAAYADFLFNYKWSVAYPHDFVPYYLSTSAAKLDSQLAPFFAAFNRDIAKFLEGVQGRVRQELIDKGNSKKELYSSGIISVRAISGLQAEVDTKTANFFDATPPLTVNDLAKGLKDAESNLPTVAQANLGAHAGALVMAGLNAQRPAVARVGRGLNLTVTPTSLATASTAELKITLEANEDSDTGIIFKDKDQSKQVDDTSRVAQHKLDTSTRVDNMKLFELSTFSASLRRRGQSFPLLPPFLELPYVGSLVKIPLPSSPTYHRSFAIVNAVVVPTAADLAFGISFTGDREVVKVSNDAPPVASLCLYEPAEPAKKDGHAATACAQTNKNSSAGEKASWLVRRLHSANELSPHARPYHTRMLHCLQVDWEGCETDLSFDKVAAEER